LVKIYYYVPLEKTKVTHYIFIKDLCMNEYFIYKKKQKIKKHKKFRNQNCFPKKENWHENEKERNEQKIRKEA